MSELIDNRAQRVRTMKTMIERLHAGGDPETVRIELRQLVGRTDAAEIAAVEQELIAAGVSVEQIKPMCDMHAHVVRDLLHDQPGLDVPPGHPVDTFRRENVALRALCAQIRAVIGELATAENDQRHADIRLRWLGLCNQLMDVDKHYHRKEHLVFACLERHGILGPSKVMWAKDDDIRATVAALREAVAGASADAASLRRVAQSFAGPALVGVEGMVEKEEHILLPMALQTLTEAEWAMVFRGSAEIGWCLVDPAEGYQPAGDAGDGAAGEAPRAQGLALPTGVLRLDQLVAIFNTLPVDLTFVDADDRVRFFSEGPNRVFIRGKAVLGRKVQHCHPPASVDIVDRILSDFRSGAQSVAEFWIDFRGRFVHIRYFAVRDSGGAYLGTLEVTQDVSAIRKLEGEQRLLHYAGGPSAMN